MPSILQNKTTTLEALYLVLLSAILWASIDNILQLLLSSYSNEDQLVIYTLLFLVSIFLLVRTHAVEKLFNL